MWRYKERFRKLRISKAEKLYYTAIIGYIWYEAPFNLILYSSSMGSIKAAIKKLLNCGYIKYEEAIENGRYKKIIQ